MNLLTITTTDVQRNFKKVLDMDEPVVVMRDSVPEKVVLPYDEYVRMVANQRRYLREQVEAMLDRVHEANKDVSDAELDDLVEEALHAAGRD